jgi:hypothetical protein
MASPIGSPINQGDGLDQLKAQIIQWIRTEIRASQQGGIGLHVDGATGDLVADRGQFRSMNYAPGAAGWSLFPSGDQELHGSTVIGGNTTIGGVLTVLGRDMAADQAALTAAVANIATQQATLTTQQAYLASLVTKDATAAGFNTGTLINDATIRYVGATASVSIAVPTGKIRVIVSCPEASMNPGSGSGSIEALASFSLAGPTTVAMGTYTSRAFTTGPWIGSTLARIKTLTVTPGTYTVTMQAGYWCAGYAAASINFADLDLSAEVVNGS